MSTIKSIYLRIFKRKNYGRRGYMLLEPKLHTVSRRRTASKPRNTGIELQDNIRWWATNNDGHFNYNLYIEVVKAKMGGL